MGHFVPRLRLGLVSLSRAVSPRLGNVLRFFRLLALVRGLPFVTPSRAAIKSITFPTDAGPPMPGIVVCFSSLPGLGARLPSQRREYSFYRQPPKNLLCCEIEKASLMAGLQKIPLSSCYIKIIPRPYELH